LGEYGRLVRVHAFLSSNAFGTKEYERVAWESMGKRDLVQCQKRPSTVSKEYERVAWESMGVW